MDKRNPHRKLPFTHSLMRDFAFYLYNMKSRFHGSVLGVLWVVSFPCLIFFAHSFMVRSIRGERFLVMEEMTYILVGTLSWYFINMSYNMNVNSLIYRAEIFKVSRIEKGIFARLNIIENFNNMILAFFLIGLILTFKGGEFFGNINYFYLVWGEINLALFVYYSSRILSYLNLMFRDVGHIVSFGLMILFFTTPILYRIPEHHSIIARFQALNPFYFYISFIQQSCTENVFYTSWELGVYSAMLTIFTYFLCRFVTSRLDRKVYFYV